MSKKTVSTERLYYLGEYRNIKISESVDVDDSISEEELDNIRLLQLVELELRHKIYLGLLERVNSKETLEDKLVYLNDIKSELLNKNTGEN